MARVFGAMVAAGVALIAFSACFSGSETSTNGQSTAPSLDQPSRLARSTDASIRAADLLPAAPQTASWLQRIEGWATVDRSLADLLAPREGAFELGLDEGSDDLESAAYRLAPMARNNALFLKAAVRATSAIEISLAPRSGLGFSLARQGARGVAGQLERGRLVFVDAYPATDVVVAAADARLEELVILKDERAPRSFSWRIALGPGLSDFQGQPDGSLLARSAESSAALRILRPRLIDSSGRQRTLTLHYEDSLLRIDVDARGLSFPLLLDPMIESVLWELIGDAGGSPRGGHAGARLASGGIVYGGEAGGNPTAATLLYSAGTKKWEANASTTPGPLRGHGMAFNGTNAVLFGGSTGAVNQNKTWLWTGADWSDGCTGGCTPPSARQGVAMAFAGGGKLLLFGGSAGPDETWEYTANSWSLKCTGCVAGTNKPTARSFARMAYAGGSSVLLFGGSAGADETWQWNGTDWEKKCAACVTNVSKPSGRARHGMAWDENRKKVLLFGGFSAGGQQLDDTWEWDAASDEWTPTTTGGPSKRSLLAMFYEPTTKRTLVFGGETDAVTPEVGDTYEYHARGGDCSTASDCNTGFCKDGKCCETACTGDCKTCAGANYGLCENVGSASGVEDADTCSGTEACNAAAVCKLKQGQACTQANGSECLSTFCSDGRCCSAACTGACKTCANSQGTCSNVAKLSTDNAPACSGNNACDGAGACKEANGQTCSAASECASGNCIDGRCCESSCTDSCKSCGNAAGTCTSNVAKGSTDANASPACNGNNVCDGAGTCKKANGQSCGSDGTQCASGFCADGKCCDSACDGECNECSDGSCSVMSAGSIGSPSCAPYACNGSSAACPESCANDNSCAADHYCKQGTCTPDEAVGAACDRDKQCSGNHNCVDGFCCDSACTGACNACSNAKKGAGADGTCGAIVDGAAPRAPGCALGASKCLADGKCNGQGACRAFAPNTTGCGAGTVCTNNAVSGQLCDGLGNCQAGGGSQPCAPALCVGGACNTSCTGNDDCHAAGFCAGTVCAEKLNDGESCGADDECQNGHCVDGVCCNNACEGACQSCSTGVCELREAGDLGGPSCAPFVCDGISELCPDSCTSDEVCVDTFFCKLSDNLCQPRENGTPCTDDDQCPERFCVDGVCCGEACDGQCEHCDATGACVATEGAPLGERDACAGHVDCAGSCDGRDRTQCTGAKAEGTACGAASCSANIATLGACDASSECRETSTDCDPYVCGDTSCKTSCAKDGDCKAGFSCVDEACVPSAGGGVCDGMGVKLTSADGEISDCTPFVCRAGECLRTCTASTDCQPGFACNTTQGNGVCESLSSGADDADDAGCGCRAVGTSSRGTRAGYGTLLALAGLLWRRRRHGARAV